MSASVRAAGGVVVRTRGDSDEVLIVHRPRYDDWTLPKGKAAPGESDEDCALREVAEETGLQCRLGRELQSQAYVDGRGRPKSVRYWLMAPLAGAFVAGAEIDDARWLSFVEAAELLTYDRDRSVLDNARREGEIS